VWPTLAPNARGEALAIWLRYPPGRSIDNLIEARFAGADGSLGALLRLTPRGDYDDPHALLRADGMVVAAWVRRRNASGRIELVRLRARP
jgi:hypothetical protein